MGNSLNKMHERGIWESFAVDWVWVRAREMWSEEMRRDECNTSLRTISGKEERPGCERMTCPWSSVRTDVNPISGVTSTKPESRLESRWCMRMRKKERLSLLYITCISFSSSCDETSQLLLMLRSFLETRCGSTAVLYNYLHSPLPIRWMFGERVNLLCQLLLLSLHIVYMCIYMHYITESFPLIYLECI